VLKGVIGMQTNKYQVVVGSDEAGKGEWLGPLTVAAVALSPEQDLYLVTQGVLDSKKLKIEKVIELADIIKSQCLSYRVISIAPKKFNQLLREVKDEGKSMNDLLAWAHAKAVKEVYSDLQRRNISGKIKLVIDQFDKFKTEERLRRAIEITRFDVEQTPKAEEETAVAAAGILARAVRELWIDDESKRLHLDLRNLSPVEALNNQNAEDFAKVSFLHRKTIY